jgi:mycothiol system anti-sigma-R factor
MNYCENIRARLTLYLDGELEGSERSALEAHLDGCDKCRAIRERERSFLETVRHSRPFPSAPDELRDRVKTLIEDLRESPPAPARLRRNVYQMLWLKPAAQGKNLSWRLAVIAVIVVLALPLGFWLLRSKNGSAPRNGPSEFALMAADTHLRHTRGQLPLEIASDSPERISNWFSNKVQFAVKLPNYQESSGQEKLYRLEGARLVAYKNDYAAHVAYQMNARPITLVITSDNLAQPIGGEEIKAKGLVFHYDTIGGLKVITWSDRGLTYALVSALEERGQQSCVVCHAGTKDQDFIKPLKPK